MKTRVSQFQASWAARIVASIACLAAAFLIGTFMTAIITLFGTNYDVPPTWYWALTVLISVVDIAAMCFVTINIVRVLTTKIAPAKMLRIATLLVLLLAAAHALTVQAYSTIPQWDFQDSLFDDLSRPGPGILSQECQPQPTLSTEQFISYEEVARIALMDDWQARYNKLVDKRAAGWHGWIIELSKHGFYSNPQHRLVVVTMDKPYSQGTGSDTRPLSQAVISYFSPADVAKLSVGQEVYMCGAINDVSVNSYGTIFISVSQPIINPLPMPEALTSTQVPDDFALEYEAHGCGEGYPCPEYDIRVDASGTATYNGQDNVPVTGTQTVQVPGDKLRELVFELQRTGFLSIGGVPGKIEGSLQGSTILRVRMDGKSKTIALPWAAGVWPRAVDLIIGKIEEVTNLKQWVKLVRSP